MAPAACADLRSFLQGCRLCRHLITAEGMTKSRYAHLGSAPDRIPFHAVDALHPGLRTGGLLINGIGLIPALSGYRIPVSPVDGSAVVGLYPIPGGISLGIIEYGIDTFQALGTEYRGIPLYPDLFQACISFKDSVRINVSVRGGLVMQLTDLPDDYLRQGRIVCRLQTCQHFLAGEVQGSGQLGPVQIHLLQFCHPF